MCFFCVDIRKSCNNPIVLQPIILLYLIYCSLPLYFCYYVFILLLTREYRLTLATKTYLTPPLLIGVPVPIQEREWSCMCVRCIYYSCFCEFSIGFRNCSDSVVFLFFSLHFISYFSLAILSS